MFSNIPVVTKNLLLVNVTLYIVSLFFASSGTDLFGLLSSHYINSMFFEPYQIVTHMFMHSQYDILHIFFNMFLLVMFGSHLERIWGPKRYFMFYIAAGMGAFVLYNSIGVWQIMQLKQEIIANQSYKAIGFMSFEGFQDQLVQNHQSGKIFSPDPMYNIPPEILSYEGFQNSTILGASGAIFGLLAGFAVLFPNTELMLLFPPIPIKAKYLIGGYLAFEIYNSIYRTDDHIAHLAHVGGAVVGIIIVLIWRKKDRQNFY